MAGWFRAQISGATLIALLALYFWMLGRRWPFGTTRAALEIRAPWVVLTVSFEFGFGHYVDGKSWSELFKNYNLPGSAQKPLRSVGYMSGR